MKNLYKKMAEIRGLIGKVTKNQENKFLKNSYADLNAVLEVIDPALEEVGLIFVDRIEEEVSIHELIDIESGEMISSKLKLFMAKQDPQSYGAAQTYNRRYARLAMLNLEQADDDGNQASGKVYATPKQIREINELILATKSDAIKFLQYFHVDAVKNLSKDAAIQAIKTLQLKAEKDKTDGSN